MNVVGGGQIKRGKQGSPQACRLICGARRSATMLRRDEQLMALEELDYIAVYLNPIHMTRLSEPGSGKPS